MNLFQICKCMLPYYELQYLRCVSKHLFLRGGALQKTDEGASMSGDPLTVISHMLWSDGRDNDVGSVESLKAPLDIKGLLIS